MQTVSSAFALTLLAFVLVGALITLVPAGATSSPAAALFPSGGAWIANSRLVAWAAGARASVFSALGAAVTVLETAAPPVGSALGFALLAVGGVALARAVGDATAVDGFEYGGG